MQNQDSNHYVYMRCTCAHICVYVSRVLRVYIHVYAYVSRHKDRHMYSHDHVRMDRHKVDIFHDIDLMIEGNDNIVLFDFRCSLIFGSNVGCC